MDKPLDNAREIIADKKDLEHHEAIIQSGLRTFTEVGASLMIIRDNRLYKETHPTFESYCQERWGWSRQHATHHIQAAQIADILSTTVDKPTTERQARELTPLLDQPDVLRETWDQVQAEGNVTAQSVRDAVREKRDARRHELREINRGLVESGVSLPVGQFSTIVVDPPWDWNDEGDQDQMGRARPTYSTMPYSEIKDLPIPDLSMTNAHIYLWITNRSLPKGFSLLEHWGFRYITCLTWCKPSFGMGNYYRGSTEQILFGVKGSLPLLIRNLGTWFAAPRGKQHSEKPQAFYEMVESASPGPWLDMFARKERLGWVAWGAETR
jgi:N6-adenosine-specific RNA methylase IME4